MPPKIIVERGTRFGKLTVLYEVSSTIKLHRMFRLACDCGGETTVTLNNLRRGNTTSCGCWGKTAAGLSHTARAQERLAKGIKLRGKPIPEYGIWSAMIQRCENPNDLGFSRYGGRGITICAEWRASFTAFIADMGLRPSPEHSIDRIDNDGNYEPGNVRWATKCEQARNRRSNVFLTLNGKTRIMVKWSEISGISYNVLKLRKRHGWSDEEALTIPLGGRR